MTDHPTVLITGAAGNLGGLLARHLQPKGFPLRLMFHTTPLGTDLTDAPNVTPIQADLARPETLEAAARGADVVVHFAGVLFAPQPEKFLPETNTMWFANLLEACAQAQADRVVLISFPHVEGETTVNAPAAGRLDAKPISAHARTRLEEERLLFERAAACAITPLVLRLGMVYGRGILMIEAARWLAKHRLLAVWNEPTWIHLLSTADFLAATEAAITLPEAQGIYHVGDEQPITLQEFLTEACRTWQLPPPRTLPVWLIHSVATLCELFALVMNTRAPLTRDFIRIGRVSYAGDTRRARAELIPVLQYPTLTSGASTLL
ncbi:MAG: NAD(P)H-binding protein [Acidobacteriota bacterium]|nr:NAD(P)H-binding protein [Acidobacteriota bacterium]